MPSLSPSVSPQAAARCNTLRGVTAASPRAAAARRALSLAGLGLLFALLLSSCTGHRHLSRSDYQALARAGQALGFDIGYRDPHALYLEAASWIGTPYRAGGNTRSGVDCSGLSCNIYRAVYAKALHRRSADQYGIDLCRVKRKRRALEAGDLVFFDTSGRGTSVNHVGIYLKGDRFIHAGSTRGVVVEHLDTRYWKRTFVAGGSVCR